MALSQVEIEKCADRLDIAESSRTQVRQFSAQYPDFSIADAYAVQRAWVKKKCVTHGRHIIGHKIGLTSRAMQVSSNISEPDHGVLLDDMLFESSTDIPFARFIVPRIEVEIAFMLDASLKGEHCSIFDVLRATSYVVPAIEIIDARIEQVDRETKVTRKVVDTISDNAANAGIILGGRPMPVDAVDLRMVPGLCFRNGVIEESGVSAAVLNHPANGVAWLVRKLAQYDVGLEAGQIVLGGSFTRPVSVKSGDTYHVEFGPLGSIAGRFV